MKTIALDTNIIIDIISGKMRNVAVFDTADRVIVPMVVLGELYAGFDDTRRSRAKRAAIDKLLKLHSVETVTLTMDTVGYYAAIRRQLKASGTPIPQNDVWIAAQTMEHGAVLCTRDSDFRAVVNLRILPEP